MASTKVDSFIDKFNTFTQKPVNFLSVQDDLKEDIKNLVKSLYDFTKSQEGRSKGKKKSALRKLIIQDFDEEQVWQQIELQNTECCEKLVWEVANVVSNKDGLLFPVEVQRDSKEEKIENDSENESMDHESVDTEENEQPDFEEPKKMLKSNKNKTKQSIVDDNFFKLRDMENFLINEEKRDSSKGKKDKTAESDEESIDLFEDIDDEDLDEEDGGKDMMYSDFFDGQDEEQDDINDDANAESDESSLVENSKKIAADSTDDDNDESDNEAAEKIVNGKLDNERKSEFEQRQQRLQQTITRLEEKTLREAPWQLKGEVDASKRPQNSLLEEVVDFDLTSRPPPIITEQTTVTLEDIIRRRVKDKAWDDVVKKEKPVDDQLSFRKNEVLDQSKSKLSLAQVYEAEYLKQKQSASGEVEEEKELESHTEVRDAMKKLFAKLDALCHYHYTPKAPQAEVKIVSNTPAISMEEVAPVATSDAALLAPEEVKKKHRGEFISKEERTQTDKNRERRKKKKLQRQKGKVMKVTEHRNTKKGIEANDKSLKTSKAFFQQLNDDSSSLIKKSNKMKHNPKKNKGQ
ncbi:U3 small nucleolar ribonucleoprotein protein MPP10 [Galleria mellonella]|uniref:U3 small nucleolar ribonucleoprotein protein MPP10 n=1 Tax=Galleria mellonella TaxID=7137 RepID=A0A6J1WH14_GALME|nr:U3 small nucleolar ribonucleoprotein protein MPP10 [Galleria mellonella]